MGKIKGHSIIKEVRGSIGQDLYVRKSGKNTIVSRKGIARRSTKHQDANRHQFAQGAYYARTLLLEPALARDYKIMSLLQGFKSAKSAAISDYLRQPEIKSIETASYHGEIGDSILIKDKHMLKLINVEVSISAVDGTFIEQGKAVPCELDWEYKATVRNHSPGGTRITVIGVDRLRRSITKVVRVDG